MGRVAFQNANLLDGERAARPRQCVLLDGERIVAVGDEASCELRPDDERIDLAGRTLMPGMASCHFHTTFENVSPVSAPSLGLQSPPAYLALLAAKNVRIALDCGVTSILCSSTTDGIDASLKASIEEGWMPGPRMRSGSRELSTSGDLPTGASHNWYMELGNTALVRTADGANGFRAVVRDEIKQGAEVIKLSVSQGHNAGPTLSGSTMREEEITAAATAAHARGKMVRAHAVSKESILACARAGVDVIDHADQMDDECIDAVLRSGSSIVPSIYYTARTLGAYDQGLMDAWLPKPLPASFYDTMESMRRDMDSLKSFLPKLVSAGVDILAGDDYGTVFLHHGEYAKELEFYVKEVGIDALEVLCWATRNGARRVVSGEAAGEISEGKLADLVVVDGDPSADIACLQDPARLLAVIKGGVFAKDALRQPPIAGLRHS